MREVLKLHVKEKALFAPFLKRDEEVKKVEAYIYENYKETDLSESYKYLKKSFIKEYEFIKNNTNIVIEPFEKKGQPYNNSKEMFDNIDKDHYYYFKTEYTKDSNNNNSVNESMLEIYDNKPLNDIFRIVHDIIGHYAFENDFSQDGEIRAWYISRSLMDKRGWTALWTETRGQNATFYYGKYKDIEISNRPFPEQKQIKAPDEYL